VGEDSAGNKRTAAELTQMRREQARMLPLCHFRNCMVGAKKTAADSAKNRNSNIPMKTRKDKTESAAWFISTIIYIPV
jgi:hypothetical protein